MTGLINRWANLGLFLVLAAANHVAIAQPTTDATPSPDEEYEKKIKAASEVSAMKADFAGEQISLYDKSTDFFVTDVDVPGNNALPVRLSRHFKVEARPPAHGYLLGFSDWEIAIPRIEGTFLASEGWTVEGQNPTARCSSNAQPHMPDPTASGYSLVALDVWSGNNLHIPGVLDEELLTNPSAKLPSPTDGLSYPWVTASLARVRCLPSAENYPGEAFVAKTPDGIEYTFKHVEVRRTENVLAYHTGSDQGWLRTGSVVSMVPVARNRVSFLVTLIKDRFGNTVTYQYSGDKLTSISASDGRSITLTYDGDVVSSVSANGRTWNYHYVPTTGHNYPSSLSSVELPDGSSWSYGAIGNLSPYRDAPDGKAAFSCVAESEERIDDTGYHLTIGHPSGATAVFDFSYGRKRRSHTPIKRCFMPYSRPGIPDASPLPYASHYWDGYGLDKKTITGPGLPTEQWTYIAQGVAPNYYTSGQATDGCADCQQTKTVTVTANDGTFQRYTFGVMYGLNDGKLLSTETGEGASVLREVTNSYLDKSELAGQAFPDEIGTSGNLIYSFSNRIRPVNKRVTVQDGVVFASTLSKIAGVYSLDPVGRPTSVIKSSSLGFTQTEATTYYDNTARWVLGQVGSVTCTAPVTCAGTVVSKTEYDNNAMPWRRYGAGSTTNTGKLQETLTYSLPAALTSQSGTLYQVKDGVGNTTTLTNWYRGVPRSIAYADGTSESVTVDGNGWITTAKDQNGFTTSYGYDPMGRVASITYPAGDSTDWNVSYRTFSQIDSAEYGIGRGHWKETVSTGDARHVTFYDGLWRPLISAEYDVSNVANTKSFTRVAYDLAGNKTFSSYASSLALSVTDQQVGGIRKTYDPLGRLTDVYQDSEWGVLHTRAEFQSGFKAVVTNPRGVETETSYMAYDTPSTQWPVRIRAARYDPAEADTDIQRDDFGKPLVISRHNPSNSAKITRSFVYNIDQRLCKSVEPETGVSVFNYDNAGNLVWTAAGQALNASDCTDLTAVSASDKISRTYDRRNRLSQMTLPDGEGYEQWTYTPDGLPLQVTNDKSGTPVTTAYHYNKRRLLDGTGETLTQPGWYSWGIGYGYDANGNLSVNTYPAGLVIYYRPNALGQATGVTSDQTTFAYGAKYYPNGALKSFAYGNGIIHQMFQNARGLPQRSIDADSTTTYLDDSYDYDRNGNVVGISDGRAGARSDRTMLYDALDRLTDVDSPMYGTAGAHYTFNALDNIKTITAPGRNQDYYYDETNRLTNILDSSTHSSVHGIAYDAQGNVSNKDGWVFNFDHANRLRWVNMGSAVEQYRYDGYGRRVLAWNSKLGNILSQYGHDGKLMFQSDQRIGKSISYMYLGGSLIAQQSVSHDTGTVSNRFEHTDALGSPVTETNGPHIVLEVSEYEPYGSIINRPLTDGPGFAGHVSDADTALSYMQQRYYDPTIGRFLSVDPIGGTSGSSQFNRYWYANGNPYKFTDPDGRAACTGTHIGECVNGETVTGLPNAPTMKAIRQNPGIYLNRLNAIPNHQRSENQSARYFARVAMPVTIATGREVGADIARLSGSAPFSVLNFELGSPANGDGSGSVEQGQQYSGPGERVAIAHTHPANTPFSGADGCYCYGGYRGSFNAVSDVTASLTARVNSYVATPDGGISKFDFQAMSRDVSRASVAQPSAYLEASSYMSAISP